MTRNVIFFYNRTLNDHTAFNVTINTLYLLWCELMRCRLWSLDWLTTRDIRDVWHVSSQGKFPLKLWLSPCLCKFLSKVYLTGGMATQYTWTSVPLLFIYSFAPFFLSFCAHLQTHTQTETPIPTPRRRPKGKSPQAIEKNLTNDATVKRVQHSRSCTHTFSVAAKPASREHACVMMWGSTRRLIISIYRRCETVLISVFANQNTENCGRKYYNQKRLLLYSYTLARHIFFLSHAVLFSLLFLYPTSVIFQVS